ncbi:hypothetical protein [Flavobacterium oreochromis]
MTHFKGSSDSHIFSFYYFCTLKQLVMETIKIEFNSSIKEKLMEFLNSFSKTEINIIEEDEQFLKTKKRVQESYEKLKSGKTKTYTLDELDSMLEETISKYENRD